MPHRVVVIGASAGGIEALTVLLSQLPGSLDASVLVVLHLHASAGSHLIEMLKRSTALEVEWARDGAALETGHVYVAPPGVHLVVSAERMHLVAGPRENFARPCIDRLFRSAGAHHGARVVGVLLTGLLYDGAAGLVAIRRHGGTVIVQDPDDAAHPEMPRSALARVVPDAVLPLAEIGRAIVGLTSEGTP